MLWVAAGVGRSVHGRIDLIAVPVLCRAGVIIVRYSTGTTARRGSFGLRPVG